MVPKIPWQLSNTWPQQKTTNVMWSSLWPWDERGVNVNMGAAQHCQSWRAEPPPLQMFTWHSDAQCCNITLITRVRRENGRQYAQRPDRARGLGQRGHHQQTQSLLTESYQKNKTKRQQCAAPYGPAVRIWLNLTIHWRRKKEWKAGKWFSCFDEAFFLELHGYILTTAHLIRSHLDTITPKRQEHAMFWKGREKLFVG